MKSSFALLLAAASLPAQTRDEILAAMKKAATYYTQKVSREGGYHFTYADDLTYGRSEHGEGPSQAETQREGTPRAGMALLEAYEATKDRFYLDAAKRAAHALVRGQLCSGGWDYLIEFDPAKRARYPYRDGGDCSKAAAKPPTTLDDNVTQACLRLLMRVDRELGFQDAKIHEAALYALDKLRSAQYANGAWPQRFSGPVDAAKHPPKKASYPESWPRKWPGADYQLHYTFNDNTICDLIDTFLEAARIYNDQRYRDTAEKGGGFILMAQMPEPQPAWAQQYDSEMHPAWARIFEPPSVTGGESQSILQTLFVLYRETGQRKYLDAAGPALAWLERSVLPRPASNPAEVWRRLRGNGNGLARFYELRTNKPLYITKGTQVQARGAGSSRIDGYELSYSDASVITHYGVLVSAGKLPALRQEYEALARSGAKPRPDRLHGLSPWAEPAGPLSRKPKTDRVQALIHTLNDDGAWVEDGTIGKSDRVMSVTAARPMVLTINGRPQAINENDRVELFQGEKAPRQRVLRTATFAENLETLAAALH